MVAGVTLSRGTLGKVAGSRGSNLLGALPRAAVRKEAGRPAVTTGILEGVTD